MPITLYPHQKSAVASGFEYLSSHAKGNPVLCMPTGTGKSFVIADMLKVIHQNWPGQRSIVTTHVKELIKQNSNKLQLLWPTAPFGIVSAGLKRKEHDLPIVFSGIASSYKEPDAFGHRDLMFVDECHLLSPKSDGMYQVFINGLLAINPKLRIIGLTATPYRTGQGYITDGGFLTDIAFDITGLEAFNQLIADGYMSTLISKKTVTQIDLTRLTVSSVSGDFNLNQAEHVLDKSDINYKVCKEAVEYGQDRHCWLAFASGIKHSEHIAEMLKSFGISAVAIHSKMGDGARDKAIEDFQAGKYRCAVNNNVLTTGFDHPPIDMILMLRPTMSTGLWVQMLGRGTRPSPMKLNCLCLDFTGNTARLGPINDPLIPRPKGSGTPGVPPIRICDMCGVYNHANARICVNCGYEFPSQVALLSTASERELIVSDLPQLEWFNVTRMIYSRYVGLKEIPMLKVTYVCASNSFKEYVCLEHPGTIKHIATAWWKKRMVSASQAPPTVLEALQWTGLLKVPQAIEVHTNHANKPITDYRWQA